MRTRRVFAQTVTYVVFLHAWYHEVAGKGYVNTENSQMASIDAIFTSSYHTKQLNPSVNPSADCVVNYNWLSACQGEMEPLIQRPPKHSWMSYKPQKQATVKVVWVIFSINTWSELLVNVYGYCLMVKSISCCCVYGNQLFSNSVAFIDLLTYMHM